MELERTYDPENRRWQRKLDGAKGRGYTLLTLLPALLPLESIAWKSNQT